MQDLIVAQNKEKTIVESITELTRISYGFPPLRYQRQDML